MSAALAAGLSLMGSGLNKMFTDDANRQNAEIAADNRRFQKDMMMYQNEWNSPKNQRKLFEEAGINPYMALGEFGDSTSADAGTPPTPTMEAPDVQSGFSSAANSVLQSSAIQLQNAQRDKVLEEARSVGIDNQTKLLRDIATWEELISRARQNGSNADWLITQRDLAIKRFDFESKESQSRTELNYANMHKADEESAVLDLERQIKEFDLKNVKPLEVKKLYGEIEEISSRVALNYKSIEQINAAIDNLAANTAKTWLEGLHQKYDNDVYKATKQTIIDQVKKNLGLTDSQIWKNLNDASEKRVGPLIIKGAQGSSSGESMSGSTGVTR